MSSISIVNKATCKWILDITFIFPILQKYLAFPDRAISTHTDIYERMNYLQYHIIGIHRVLWYYICSQPLMSYILSNLVIYNWLVEPGSTYNTNLSDDRMVCLDLWIGLPDSVFPRQIYDIGYNIYMQLYVVVVCFVVVLLLVVVDWWYIHLYALRLTNPINPKMHLFHIPQCINLQIYAHVCYKVVHCGIFDAL